MNWQSIETAPRDGTAILGCIPKYLPIVVQWVSKYQRWVSCSLLDKNSEFCSELDYELEMTRPPWEPVKWAPLPE